ncbi:TPA: ATP-binding protein, partial [Elizabethkingia anophelis]|nr:ATP-binding protein [Elizabethkingia anophelis]
EYLYPDNGFKSSLSTVDFDQILTSLKSIFENIESEKIVLKNNYSIKDACKAILTDYFFDHWDVKSDNDDIHKMSTGKASFVLLKLIIKLSKDNGPILIDQPEDNLDNRSVSKELVEYLKINKRNRQIILVTHNPNIVVNADSENIIVANQKGQNDVDSESPYQFDFINGSLENTFPNNGDKNLLKSMGIREHIADIVEGGMEAFRQRERKYSFKKE